VDRQEGGHDNLAGLGVELHSLLTRMNLDQANGQH
jgi:orotate phosphoribosyltransferase